MITWIKKLPCFRSKTSDGPRRTKLPKAKVIIACLLIFSNNFSLIVVFPLIPYMLQKMLPELSKDELGSRAGYLTSAWQLGILGTSFLWARISDRFGRKPVMLFSAFGSICGTLTFLFSPSYGVALMARILWGIMTGTLAVVKTYLSEILDETNMGLGFQWFGAAASGGRVIAPAVGGLLARPADHFPSLKDNKFFQEYPYVLPAVVPVAVSLTSIMLMARFLEETSPKKLARGSKKAVGNQSHAPAPLLDDEVKLLANNDVDIDDGGGGGGGGGGEETAPDRIEMVQLHSSSPNGVTLEEPVDEEGNEEDDLLLSPSQEGDIKQGDNVVVKQERWYSFFASRKPIFASLCYAFLGLAVQQCWEILPLWLLLPKEQAGFAFQEVDVGTLMSISAPIQLGLQVLYGPLTRKFGIKQTFTICSVVCAGLVLVFPTLHFLNEGNSTVYWFFLSVLWGIFGGVYMINFTSVFVLINNSVPASQRASVNGVAQTLVGISRLIGPMIGGNAFAYGATHSFFHPYFAYIFASFSFLLATLCSVLLPVSCNKRIE